MDAPDLLTVGHMKWTDLIYLHWPVPLARLGPLIPDELTLDTWRGVAYVSIVAFRMKIRAVGVPEAFAMDVHEVNVRTYVRYRNERPGIYFLSLDVDSWIAVAGARTLLGLPYYDAHCRRTDEGNEIDLDFRRTMGPPAHCHLGFRPGRALGPSKPGTLAHFLLERYALYVERSLSLWRVQIAHRPIPAQRASITTLDQDLVAAANLPQPGAHPRGVHYARVVDVDVFRPELVAMRSPVGRPVATLIEPKPRRVRPVPLVRVR